MKMFQSLFRYLLQQNNDIVLLIGRDGRIVDANDTALSAYEYNRGELLAMNIQDLCAPGDNFDVPETIKGSAGQAIKYKTLQASKSGMVLPVEIIARSASIDNEEMLLCIISILSENEAAETSGDIVNEYKELKKAYEEIKAAYKELAKTTYESFNDISSLVLSKRKEELARKRAEMLSNTDHLTGALTRRAFDKRLDAEINRARRENLSLGVVLVDLDCLEQINDTTGKQAGDEVLKILADFLMQQCRTYDFVGRYGAEEFIVCLPGAGREDSFKKASSLCENVQKLKVPGLDNVKLSASFGVTALRTTVGENIDTIIKRADKALNQAKMDGRNCVRRED
jgi:diguanylate cyclase (GGDEF)-like protein/PAS domain S-box-containing protein